MVARTVQIVLTLVAAAGVGYAALVLARLGSLPRAARLIAGVLGAYGSIAFLHGAFAGTPLPSLLAGQSLWRILPWVFQGAVVGGLVVLPLALVVSAVRLGLRAPNPGSREHAIRQTAALAAAFAIVLTALPRRGSQGAVPLPPSQITADEQTMGSRSVVPSSERLAALENSFRAIEDGARELPRDRWDPDYVVGIVGRDARQLFAWVRDNTDWIPYRGTLRGAAGVLMDRQGNSLDRALLLATLLRVAGQTARLAHGELPPAHARALGRRIAPGHRRQQPRGLVGHARVEGCALAHQRLFLCP